MIFSLQPTNEGQDLNYVEKYDPFYWVGMEGEKAPIQMARITKKEQIVMTKDRAKQIVVGLNRLMPQGSFGCVIEELNLYISPNLEEIKQ